VVAKLREGARTQVGQLVLLPVAPEKLDRVEFGSVGREKLDLDQRMPGCQVFAQQVASVSVEPIPDDQELPGSFPPMCRKRCSRKRMTCGLLTEPGKSRK